MWKKEPFSNQLAVSRKTDYLCNSQKCLTAVPTHKEQHSDHLKLMELWFPGTTKAKALPLHAVSCEHNYTGLEVWLEAFSSLAALTWKWANCCCNHYFAGNSGFRCLLNHPIIQGKQAHFPKQSWKHSFDAHWLQASCYTFKLEQKKKFFFL